jgi:hypothetical protein
MGTYQYAITKTKRIKGLSEVFGDIGVVEFRYKYSWADNPSYEKQCERLDANINRKWADKELPILVTNKKGTSLSVWVGNSANHCDADENSGEFGIGSLHGWNALEEWASTHGVLEIPLWLLQAGDDQEKGLIPFVPTTQADYRLLSDAYITLRLRERGDLYAMPQSRNNPYWSRIVESGWLDHYMQTAN